MVKCGVVDTAADEAICEQAQNNNEVILRSEFLVFFPSCDLHTNSPLQVVYVLFMARDP